jgi:hypothetical protein
MFLLPATREMTQLEAPLLCMWWDDGSKQLSFNSYTCSIQNFNVLLGMIWRWIKSTTVFCCVLQCAVAWLLVSVPFYEARVHEEQREATCHHL